VPTNNKIRLDELAVQRGLAATTDEAARLLIAGALVSAGLANPKPGSLVVADSDIDLHLRRPPASYVSRGGQKLAAGLSHFALDVSGARCLDLGASTGGFTDCLLKHGAATVTAVDVGYGQFDFQLRQDPRVRLLERTNLRSLPQPTPDAAFDLIVADLSFTATSPLFCTLSTFLRPQGQLLVLIKPQFETGQPTAVVTAAAEHQRILEAVLARATAAGLVARGLVHSPVKGPKGNIEFLFWATQTGKAATIDVHQVVLTAHRRLDKKT